MPQPLSVTWISFLPPPSTCTRMRVAPASSAFSSNSLSTEAGRSTTSPAAILLATCSGSTWMRAMFSTFRAPHGARNPYSKWFLIGGEILRRALKRELQDQNRSSSFAEIPLGTRDMHRLQDGSERDFRTHRRLRPTSSGINPQRFYDPGEYLQSGQKRRHLIDQSPRCLAEAARSTMQHSCKFSGLSLHSRDLPHKRSEVMRKGQSKGSWENPDHDAEIILPVARGKYPAPC